MSQENVDVVRTPLAVKSDSRRRLEERLGVRFPGALAVLGRAVLRLPRQSRLRRVVLRRGARLALEAANRGDYEVTFAFYDRDVEVTLEPQLASLGFDPIYRGLEARIGFQQQLVAELGELRFEPDELIDLGDGRLLTLGRIEGSGLSSGAAFGSEWGLLITLSEGRAVRERFFFDRGEALEAVGLSE